MARKLDGKSLFPYAHRVTQVKVQEAWIRHAEKHEEARRKQKGTDKVSRWVIASRISELAFLTVAKVRKLLIAVPDFPVGSYIKAIRIVGGDIVSISSSPADEKYNLGAKAFLVVKPEFIHNETIYVLAVYDSPYVDFLGWIKVSQMIGYAKVKGLYKVPAHDLIPMRELFRGNVNAST